MSESHLEPELTDFNDAQRTGTPTERAEALEKLTDKIPLAKPTVEDRSDDLD